jgi:hypothetical protein
MFEVIAGIHQQAGRTPRAADARSTPQDTQFVDRQASEFGLFSESSPVARAFRTVAA